MAKKSISTRIAYGAFAAAVFTFLGPGVHLSTNPGMPRSDLAPEAAGMGIVIGIIAILLGIVAWRRLSGEEERAGMGLAKAAIPIAGVGVAVWIVAAILRTGS